MVGKTRNPIVVIILSLITFGFYYLYWIHTITKELNEYYPSKKRRPGVVILLTIITIGWYLIYWFYKTAKIVFNAAQERQYYKISNHSILCLVCNIIPLGGFLAVVLVQTSLNSIWEIESDEWKKIS